MICYIIFTINSQKVYYLITGNNTCVHVTSGLSALLQYYTNYCTAYFKYKDMININI